MSTFSKSDYSLSNKESAENIYNLRLAVVELIECGSLESALDLLYFLIGFDCKNGGLSASSVQHWSDIFKFVQVLWAIDSSHCNLISVILDNYWQLHKCSNMKCLNSRENAFDTMHCSEYFPIFLGLWRARMALQQKEWEETAKLTECLLELSDDFEEMPDDSFLPNGYVLKPSNAFVKTKLLQIHSEALLRQGRFTKARNSFTDSLSLNPLEYISKAKFFCLDKENFCPTSELPLISKAEICFTKGRYLEAFDQISKIGIASAYVFDRNLLVWINCLAILSRISELFALTRYLIENYPHRPTSWHAVAVYHFLWWESCRGEVHKPLETDELTPDSPLDWARRYLIKAVALDPAFISGWVILGHFNSLIGDHDQSILAYSTIFNHCYQNSILPYVWMSQEYLKTRQYLIAQTYLMRAYEIDPSSPILLLELSVYYMQVRKDFEKTKNILISAWQGLVEKNEVYNIITWFIIGNLLSSILNNTLNINELLNHLTTYSHITAFISKHLIGKLSLYDDIHHNPEKCLLKKFSLLLPNSLTFVLKCWMTLCERLNIAYNL